MDTEERTKRTIEVEETPRPVQTTQTVTEEPTVGSNSEIVHDRSVSKAAQVVWFIVGVIATILLLRFVLALLGANIDNGFASFVYGISEPLVAPFRGLLQIGSFQAGVSRLEIETLLAAAIYTLIGWGIVKAILLARK
jgi:YggT family protein